MDINLTTDNAKPLPVDIIVKVSDDTKSWLIGAVISAALLFIIYKRVTK